MSRVLVVEDEPAIRDVIAYSLRADGHEVVEAEDGELGVRLALDDVFDLVLLDVMLPGLSGVEVCRRLRAEGNGDVPIIMLTARGGEVDQVLGLESGADDYVVKPFATAELLARVRAQLRRRALDRGARGTVRVGSLELDLVRNEARLGGRTVPLTPAEARLLGALAAEPDRAVPRAALVHAIWGGDYSGDGRVCDTHVKNLRAKLERDPARPERLLTVRGVGYRLASI